MQSTVISAVVTAKPGTSGPESNSQTLSANRKSMQETAPRYACVTETHCSD